MRRMGNLSRNMKNNCKKTVAACFIGYIVQAIVCTVAPLLFVTVSDTYGIPMTKITLLVTVNYILQLGIDLAAAKFAKHISYRVLAVAAQVLSGTGLILLTVLPELLPDPFVGLLVSVMVYAVGGGLLEVIISPMVESCPISNKEQMMSLLHSFFCWGQVGVVALSTLFFGTVGIAHWQILVRLWAIVPFANAIWFLTVPIYRPAGDVEADGSMKRLLASPVFWLFFAMMLCAGASEVAVSQWASTFAERGLGVSKTVGDLAGPMAFAVCMGISRLIYGFCGAKLRLERFILFSAVLCVASYLGIVFSPLPVLGLVSCGVCGFSVGIFWPGTLSAASGRIPGGGTALFALLALAGDLGCSAGPTLAGFVAGAYGDDLHKGILAAIVFPVLMLAGAFLLRRQKKKE